MGEEDGEEDGSDEQKYGVAGDVAAADDSVQGCFTHEDSVYCIDVHLHTACSGDGNNTALLWDTHTGDIMHSLTGQHRRLQEEASHTHSLTHRHTRTLTSHPPLPLSLRSHAVRPYGQCNFLRIQLRW